MSYKREFLTLEDEAILADCDVHIYKSSGPGGQHRNKVSSAVRLKHRPTGVTAHGDETRSQHQNKRAAMKRLRMKIACQVRRPIDIGQAELPAMVTECIFRPRGRGNNPQLRLEIGRRDRRFWTIAAFLLDVLTACEASLRDSAAYIGITSGNLTSLLKSDRHLLAAAQALRKHFGHNRLN